MTTPFESGDAPESFNEPSFNEPSFNESLATPPLDQDAGPMSLFQEINERRARVENTELLHHLRGL
jgi:hypothetical protein